VLDEGKITDPKQAAAVCHSLWRNREKMSFQEDNPYFRGGEAVSSIGDLSAMEDEIRNIPLPDELRADKIRESELDYYLSQP
jgi:hypothetical protein